MRTMRHWIDATALAAAALAIAACAHTAANAPAAPAPAANAPATSTPAASAVVLDDQLVGQIQRGATTMDQVRQLIGVKPIINYQAGHEIWIYQGVAGAGSTHARTVTVQFDEHGVVRNVGKVDLE
jgi:outer membrane protein assembly factor BamE (lipoprotein component of BamABCDE complex)